MYRRLDGPRGRFERDGKTQPPPELHLRAVRPVASRYFDWAIPAAINGSYLTKVPRHNYKEEPVNNVWGNNCCLSWKSYEMYKHTFNVEAGGATSYRSAFNL